MLVDKAYSVHSLRNELKRKGIKTVIPRKTNEKMAADGRSQLARDAYRNRNVVELCFGRLKEYRRIASASHVLTVMTSGLQHQTALTS